MLVGGGRGLRADLSPGAHPSRSSSEVTLGLDEGNCAMPKVDSQIYTLKAQVTGRAMGSWPASLFTAPASLHTPRRFS